MLDVSRVSLLLVVSTGNPVSCCFLAGVSGVRMFALWLSVDSPMVSSISCCKTTVSSLSLPVSLSWSASSESYLYLFYPIQF